MAYNLYIVKLERNKFGLPDSISLADWKNAVSATEGIRLCPPGVLTGRNPKTGVVVTILREGDLEVYFPDERVWRKVFRWRHGRVRFTVHSAPGDTSHPIWAAAVALASRLGVVIRGEKKEIYDLQTGKPLTSSPEIDKIDYSAKKKLREYRILFERVPEGERAYPSGRNNLGLRSKLGGEPDWDQGDDTPTCPKCGEPMQFVGQIDSMENQGPHKQKLREQDYMFGDVGMIYVFYCFDCSESQSIMQCG